MKKFLSVFLAVLMLVGMLPMTAIHTHAATANYVKVTSAPADWSGQYLIVYESGKLILNGSLTKLDAVKNTQSVSITNGAISADSKYAFTIEKSGSNYTIKSASGYYIGNTSNSNSLSSSTSTKYTNTITMESGSVKIVGSGGAVLRFNKASDQMRFRYFKSSSYTSQQAIQLYKLEEGTACEHTNTTENNDGYAATCTEAGKTNSVTCDDCGEVVTAQKDISALGHNYVDGVCNREGCGAKLPVVSFVVPNGVAAIDPVTANESGIAQLPTAGVPSGDYAYAFAGWTTGVVDNSTEAPEIIPAGVYKANANITLHALYTYNVVGEGSTSTDYVLTDIANIKATDEVVITMTTSNGVVYALPNNGGVASPSAIIITDKVNKTEGKLKADPESTLLWNIGGTAGAYILYPAGQTATWLYHTNSNSGVRIGKDQKATYSIDSTGYLKDSINSRYLGVYPTKPDWRCYTNTTGNTANQTLGFYVKSSGASSQTFYTTVITISECTHEWDAGTQTVAPTCEEAGQMTYTCTLCDETKTEVIAALGHTEGNPVKENNKDATCTEDGSYDTVVYCSVCNKELSRVTTTVEATGHSFGSDGACTVCGEAASTTAGARYYIAAIRTSGNYFYMTSDLGTASTSRYTAVDSGLSALPESITEPETGYVFVLIKNSDGTYSIQAEGVDGNNYLGHTSGNSGTLVAEASALKLKMTDNKDGTYSFSYVASDATRYLALNGTSGNNYFAWYKSGQKQNLVLIPVEDPCDHTYGEGVVTAPTCTTAGYTTYICALCGKAKTENEVPATGHSYGEGVQTTAPGCTTTGVMTYTCSACGDIKTEEIPAAGHKMDEGVVVEATCETEGSKTYTCSVCGEKQVETIDKLGHSWDEGQVVTEATCDAPGSKLYTCQNDSSHTKTEATPPKGHQFSNGVCSVCGKEVSRFQLVTDYTEILAGGEYIVAARVNDDFYAINSDPDSWLKAQSVAVEGTGADMMVIYADGMPIWNVEYFLGRNNCFSLYSPAAGQYLAGTESTSLSKSTTAWAWTFIDGSNSNGEENDGVFAVTKEDGSVAFVAASATVIDRAISLKNTTDYTNYSVRTAGYNRELYFFKLVEANETEYTVKFVENGTTTMTQNVPVNENVLKMPQPTGAEMPEGYTKFVGWVELPHTESLVAPTTIYSAEEVDGANNTVNITADKTFYALYSREDPDAEGQALSYHLVTDNNQLVIGQKYIIVGIKDGQYYAMSQDQLSGDRGASAVTPDENGVISFLPEDNVGVFELAQGYKIGSFAFLDLAMNKFLYCASSGTENALKSQATMDENSTFLITINADGYYSVIASQTTTTTRSNIMFNTDSVSDIFSCYDPNVTSVEEEQTFLYVGVPNSTFATYYTTGLCAHEWVVTEKVDATCEHAGYTIETCSICGEVRVTDSLAHGHDVGESNVITEPTCTTTGLAQSVCNKCGALFDEVIPALGHTEVVDAAVAPKCTETGLTEGKHCSVCDTVLVPQQEVAANGHSYVTSIATSNNVPTITHNCSACDEADHKSELKFVTASLTLQNNIVVNFKTTDNVFGNGVMAGFTDLRAEFTYGNRVGENMIVATSADIVKQTDGKYVVPCRQVTPSQIGDEITATLYGTYDGVEYSYVMKYSAAEYCYSTMVSEKATDDLKTLLVNLLYYCDAARTYTTYQGVDENYKYYGSVTEELTDEQKAYRTVSTQFQSVMGLSGEGDFTASWKSAALVLGESSAIQFRVDLGDNENVTAQVFVAGREYGRVQMEQITEGEYAGQYLILVGGLSAHQMRDTVQVTLYSGETAVSKTVSYSMESYVYSKQNDSNQNLVAFLQAMISYGDAAVAYKKSINQ